MSFRIPLARAHVKREEGKMNKTEAQYELSVLIPLKAAGIVAEWRFEGITLRLADKTTYTPDFLVVLVDGSIELHEVKGSWKAANQDDSRVKIKVAPVLFPWFRFTSYDFKAGKREWFGPHGAASWDRN